MNVRKKVCKITTKALVVIFIEKGLRVDGKYKLKQFINKQSLLNVNNVTIALFVVEIRTITKNIFTKDAISATLKS